MLTLKKNNKVVPFEKRIEVIQDRAKGVSLRQLAVKYECGKTQISNILKQKDHLLHEWESSGGQHSTRKQKRETYVEVNRLVWNWYQKENACHSKINGPKIKDKAREYATLLKIPSFNASNGWLYSFCKRYKIVFRSSISEKPDDSQKQTRMHVASIAKSYNPRDIFNFDETGLFFRAIPDKTIAEMMNRCVHRNLTNERLTIGLCCNAIGEKEELLVVTKSLNRSLLKSLDVSTLELEWHTNPRAFMTTDIFQKWLGKLNHKMKMQNRKIVLYLDKAPCHYTNMHFSNIELIFLDVDLSGCPQPLGQGIIQSFKVCYRRKLLRILLSRMCPTESVLQISKKISVLDALNWLKSSWEEVQPVTISNCFHMGGIISETVQKDISLTSDAEIELKIMCGTAGIKLGILDEDIQCFASAEDCPGDELEQIVCDVDPNFAMVEEVATEEDDCDMESNPILPLSLKDSLTAVMQMKALFSILDPEKKRSHVFDSLSVIEEELEDIIIEEKIKIHAQTTLNKF